jgi:hypothetical protein
MVGASLSKKTLAYMPQWPATLAAMRAFAVLEKTDCQLMPKRCFFIDWLAE